MGHTKIAVVILAMTLFISAYNAEQYTARGYKIATTSLVVGFIAILLIIFV